jgi:hypothetical protein
MLARRREVSWPLADCHLCCLDPCVFFVILCRGHAPAEAEAEAEAEAASCFEGCHVGRRVASSSCADAKRIRNAALHAHEQRCPYALLMQEQEAALSLAHQRRPQRMRHAARGERHSSQVDQHRLQEKDSCLQESGSAAAECSTSPPLASSQLRVKSLYKRLRQDEIVLTELCGDDLQGLGQKRTRKQTPASTSVEPTAQFTKRTLNPEKVSIGYAAASQSSMSQLIQFLQGSQTSESTCTVASGIIPALIRWV